ncbi:MAG: hypothetical protein CM15mP117_03130 [Alphaproteobacteria bacterium]|nr:MAG: hypothetical protein CM15mP117_03130 [Alphaproteobacteria bacterium]
MIERLSSKLKRRARQFRWLAKTCTILSFGDKPNQADNVLISATYAINSDEERISY